MKRTIMVALVVACAATAANAGYIQNGSFTKWTSTYYTSSIPDWTVTWSEQPFFRYQSGIFFTVDGVVPTYGGTMAVISTDGYRDNSPDSTTLTSAPFKVIQDRIEFQYVYATQQTAAEAASGYLDPFSVTITRTSDSAVLYSGVIEDASGDLVSGNINFPAIQGPGVRQTRTWEWVVIDSESWIGDEVTIAFNVTDAMGSVGDTGVFLDNVRNIPEPATTALFALGVLGVGGLAIVRRRRARKS
jgi:hypothetical protein